MHRQVLRLAIPNILSNISLPLLGMVDTAVMGRMESEVYIGAIALGSILFNFIYWGFGFLRMGTTGMTAQAYGRRDKVESISLLARGLLVALAVSLLLILFRQMIAWFGFSLIQGGETVKALGREYFLIRIYAAPATLALFAFHGWFLGVQNARYPLYLTVIVNLMNIGFNLLFVFQFGMKSDGVAWGTVCAQYVGLILAVGLFLHKYRSYLDFVGWRRTVRLSLLGRFFTVNADIFIRTVCLVFAFAFFTSASSAIDSLTLAANQILLQYISLMSFAVDGFAFAAESLVGKYVGARDKDRLRRSVRMLMAWGISLGAGFALGYAFLGKPLLRVFTDQMMIIQAASPYLWWMAIIPLAGSIAYMWDGVYIGATATRSLRNMMLLSTLGIFLPVYYVAVGPLGNHGLWLALMLFMIARGVTLTLQARQHIFG
jgi:MATE family multidrug resistance protein